VALLQIRLWAAALKPLSIDSDLSPPLPPTKRISPFHLISTLSPSSLLYIYFL